MFSTRVIVGGLVALIAGEELLGRTRGLTQA
jgi:hypothetical protein